MVGVKIKKIPPRLFQAMMVFFKSQTYSQSRRRFSHSPADWEQPLAFFAGCLHDCLPLFENSKYNPHSIPNP